MFVVLVGDVVEDAASVSTLSFDDVVVAIVLLLMVAVEVVLVLGLLGVKLLLLLLSVLVVKEKVRVEEDVGVAMVADNVESVVWIPIRISM